MPVFGDRCVVLSRKFLLLTFSRLRDDLIDAFELDQHTVVVEKTFFDRKFLMDTVALAHFIATLNVAM